MSPASTLSIKAAADLWIEAHRHQVRQITEAYPAAAPTIPAYERLKDFTGWDAQAESEPKMARTPGADRFPM
jgi:hypothetical protein